MFAFHRLLQQPFCAIVKPDAAGYFLTDKMINNLDTGDVFIPSLSIQAYVSGHRNPFVDNRAAS